MSSKLQKSLSDYNSTLVKEGEILYGNLGTFIGGRTLVSVPGRAGYVYVRLRTKLSELIEAFNSEVAQKYNTPVLVERKGNRYVVIGRNTETFSDWETNDPYIPQHAEQHIFDKDGGNMGGDPVWVYPYQFMPALVTPFGSRGAANVFLHSYPLHTENGWKYTGNTGTPRLTQYNPESGATLVLVTLDSQTGNPAIFATTGTFIPESVTGTSQLISYLPQVSDLRYLPDSFVRLVSGTSSIGWSNIYDVRQFLSFSPSGTSYLSINGNSGIDDLEFTGALVSVTGTTAYINITGSSGGVSDHEALTGLLGGSANDHWHLTPSQVTGLVSGTSTALHSHAGGIGTGTAGQVVKWGAAGDTLVDAALIPPATNILTLTATAASTLGLAITAGKTLTLTATDDSSITFTGASNLTIPTAGSVTAALLGTANVFTAVQKINVNSTTAFFVEQDGVKDNTFIVDTTNARVGVNIAPLFPFHVSHSMVGGATSSFVIQNTNLLTTDQVRLQFLRGYDAGAGTAKGMVLYSSDTQCGWADYEGRTLSFFVGAVGTANEAFRISPGNTIYTTNATITNTHPTNSIITAQALNAGYAQFKLLNTAARYQIYLNPDNSNALEFFYGTGSLYVMTMLTSGLVGIGNQTPTTKLHVTSNTAATNTVVNVLKVEQTSTGTAANGLGAGLLFSIETATASTMQSAGRIYVETVDATNATRKYKTVITAFDTLERIGITIAADGTLAQITNSGTLTLRTGSATALTAPLKFVSGTLMTAAEVGAVEFLTDKYYATVTTAAERKEIKLYGTYYGGWYAYEKAIVFGITVSNTYHALHLITAGDFVAGSLNGFTFDAGRAVDANITSEASGTGGKLRIVCSGAHSLTTGDLVMLGNMNNAGHNKPTRITTDGTNPTTEFLCDDIAYVAGAGDSAGTVDKPAYLQASTGSAGVYHIGFTLDGAAAAANKTWKFEVNVNITTPDNVVSKRVSSGTIASMTSTGNITVADGDRIWLSGKNSTDTSDYTIENMNINLFRL